MNNMWNLDQWKTSAIYLVLDDIEYQYIPAKKPLFGSQKVFSSTDKYKRKVELQWGKPCIYLCNEENYFIPTLNITEQDWFKENTHVVKIYNKLY